MRLVADHSLEFLNLWILMLLYSLPILLVVVFRKHVFHPTASRFSSARSSREYRLFIASKFIMLFYFLYAIALPIRLETAVAITGLAVYAVGFVFYSAAWITVAVCGGGKVVCRKALQFS